MKNLLFALLCLPMLAFGQATTGFHRVAQVIARAPLNSVNAQVVPFATVFLTNTATGIAAAAFSDPLLSSPVPNSTLTADASGNYDYYLALNTCVTETISTPGGGITVIPNICSNSGSGGSGCITSGLTGALQGANGTGGCQPVAVEINGVNIASGTAPNFVSSSTVTVTNPTTNQISFTTIPGLSSFTSGNLSPLFTTSLGSNPTTAPALTFSLDTTSNLSFLGNVSGSTNPWSAITLVAGANITFTPSGGNTLAISSSGGGGGGNTTNFEHNDTLLTGLFSPNAGIQVFNVDDFLPAPPFGNSDCTWQTDSATGRVSCYFPNSAQMLIVPPIGGNFVFVPFTTVVPFQSSIPTSDVEFTNTSGNIVVFANGSGFPPSSNSLTYSNAVLPSWLPPASVTAVYAYFWQGGNSSVFTVCDGGTTTGPLQVTHFSPLLSGRTGFNIGGATCVFNAGGSGPRTQTYGTLPMIGLLAFYSGGPNPPPQPGTQFEYPLQIDPANGAVTVSTGFPTHVNPIPIASLPASEDAPGEFYAINDGISNADCTVGGGTTTVWCASNGFGGWTAFGGSEVYPAAGLGFSTGSAWATFTPSQCSAGNAATGIDSNGNAHGCFAAGGSGLSGMTAGQVPIAATASTVTSSKALAGSGTAIPTGPASSTNLDCVQFTGTGGQIADSGAPCGSGSGGYTNVNASSSGDTTVSAINGKCVGGQTYWASIPLSIATGGTISSSCNVMFVKGAVWTIAVGQTVTFANQVKENDGPSQHFAGAGTVVLPAQDAAVEWFGAVGFTTQGAAISGTDSLASINKCFSSLTSGQCKMQALFYRTTASLTVANSGVGLAGASAGGVIGNLGTGATPSAIVLTSASADILDVGSASAFIYNNTFNDFSLFRSAFGTGTAAGIRMIKCASCIITRTYSNDSVYNYYLEGAPAYGSGGITNNGSQWGYNGLTPSGTVHGFFIDTTVPAQSMQMNYNIAANATSILTTATGFECNGAGGGCVDIMGVGNQTAQIGTGVSVTGASDFHWTDSIDDQDNTCISISGASSANFAGGWCFTNATAAVAISSSNNVVVTGKQLRTGGGGAPNLVTVSGSAGTIISNNHFFANSGANMLVETGSTAGVIANNVMNFTNTGDCISLASSSNNNAITGNTCIANQFVTGIALAGSSNNTVQANVIQLSSGGSTIGISADSGSNNNQWINLNNIQQAATLISDAGTGNKFNSVSNLTGGALGSVPYQSAANTTTFLASPTTASDTFALVWQPSGSIIAPTTLNLTTWAAVFGSISTGSGSTACGSATGCVAMAEASTAGSPTAGSDYIRADSTTHKLLYSQNGVSESALATPLYNVTGTLQASPHMVNGSGTLSGGTLAVTFSGSAVFTSSSTYVCNPDDSTGINGIDVVYSSGTAVTFNGTAGDSIRFSCVGN